MKAVGKFIFGSLFRLFGWRIEGGLPEVKKYVIVVAPHTSNWDFAVGYCVRHILDLRPDFLAKNSLFKIPLVGWFLRSMGGHPVDRSKANNIVDLIVEKFNESEKFIMTITPEGTRSYSPNWKTGFYRVAEKANVPIVLAGFDYEKKTVYFDKPRYVTGDMEADIEQMKEWFRPKKGRYPEKGVV